METHPPHVHHSSGKKFSNYFYEFLMLFLAVFCGFLAENFREVRVEHSREKEYMKSLVEDLQSDTAEIGQAIPFATLIFNNNDSLVEFLNFGNPLSDVRKIYRMGI